MFKSSTISGPLAVAGLAVMLTLSGCGGGGGGGTATTPTMPDLNLDGVRMGQAVTAGTHSVSSDLADAFEDANPALLGVDHPEGTKITIAGIMLECGVGPCRVTVNADGTITTTGTIWTAGYLPMDVADERRKAAEKAEAQALADAQDAARTAWEEARDALAGIAGKEDANPAAYQRAMNALDDAEAAYEAAMAATTSAAAKQHQADAEAARDTATMQVGLVVASYEAPDLEAAQMAAKSAADAAKIAYDAAMAELEKVEDIKDDDMASYDTAMAKVNAAKAAYEAAKAASDAAAATEDLAEAEKQQKMAEDELAKANAAKDDAMKYAGMVQTAYDTRMENERQAEATALSDAKTAAQDAYDAAMKAYEDAKKRVDALAAMKAMFPDNTVIADNEVLARNALGMAMKAHDAAKAANDMAQAAETSADAEAHQATVEEQLAAVRTATGLADGYAMLVETAYKSAEEQRKQNVAEAEALDDAKKAAKKAADDAQTAADSADEQATKVAEKLGAGSDAAKSARMAADDAQKAADAAKEASDMAEKAETSDDAEKYQKMAEDKQSEAEGRLDVAMELAREAGVATAGLDQLRIELARDAAEDAKTTADEQAKMARKKADDAKKEADAARMAADKAMRARMDYANANKHAEMAEAAAMKAEEAAQAAEKAAKEANAEYMKAMATDVTVKAARDARDEARKQRGIAMDNNSGDDGAADQYMAAMEAAGDAKKYAAMHVISLLIHANAQDLELGDAEEPDLAASVKKARDARLKAVSTAIGDAAGMPNANPADADNDSSTTDGSAATTVVVTWPADTPDNETTPANEFEAGMLGIAVAPDGTDALTFRTVAEEEDDTTTDVDETVVTATMLDPGLGRFMGYEIEDGGTHVIVFTDKTQNVPTRAAVTAVPAASLVNDPVSGSTVTDLGTKSGTGYTGVTYYDGLGTVTQDTDTNLAYMGTLTCPSATACTASTAANGAITVTGYVFTGSREATVGVTELTEAANPANSDYLAFGVWLMQDSDDTAEGDQCCDFAAFAGGGQAIADFAAYVTLTGTATYNGKAAGVYTAGDSVDYFEGDATLTANLGEKPETGDDDQNGTIKGTVSSIVAGGNPMSDVIRLSSTDINATNSAFSGDARMGAGVIQDDDTVKYPYNGSWSGRFYGPNLDDTNTADVNELAAPDAVAGTFGVTGKVGEGDDAITRSYVGAFGARR